MKNSIKKLSLLLLLISVLSCSKDDNNANNAGTQNPAAVTGTFAGNFQVSDDPLTELGYIFNSKVTVNTVGATATLKIIGNEGFDRTFTGTVTSTSASSSIISIAKQTIPIDKNASGSCVIMGNDLTMDVNLLNDNIVVRKLLTSPGTITISGKIQMIGTSFIKQ